MKSNSSKKASLPAIKPQGRKSVQFANNARDSLGSDQSSGLAASAEKEKAKAGDSTMRFVYSQAVERAFRWCFMSQDFGPRSAKPSFPPVAIDKLPQLYDDWLSVKRLLNKKEAYLKKQREDQGDVENSRLKYGQFRPYFRRKLSINVDRRRGSVLSQSGHRGSTISQGLSRKDSFNRLPTIGSRQNSFNRLPMLVAPSQDAHSVASVSTLKS